MPPRVPIPENPRIHAMCEWYEHEWRKSDMLSARENHRYDIQVCARSDCEAMRRVLKRR